MDLNELYHRIREDDADEQEMLFALQQKLREEMDKPLEERDYDQISELTQAICQLTGEEQSIQKYKEQFQSKIKRERLIHRVGKWKKPLIACCAAFAVLCAANVYTVSSMGVDLITAVHQISQNGITIFMEQNDPNESELTSEHDPYGIKAECKKYGFTPIAPSYLPEGFELYHVEQVGDEMAQTVVFYYKKGSQILNIEMIHYPTGNVQPLGIPSDTLQFYEEVVDGKTMYLLKEDDQFTAAFLYGKTAYMVWAEHLDYDECQKIIESFDD